MKTIRQNSFETNSSSSHSISIVRDGKKDTSLRPDQNGEIVLHGGEFGWDYVKHNDALTKANYLAVAGTPEQTNMLAEVIQEETGAKVVTFDFTSEWGEGDNWAYIDHQSYGVANPAFVSKSSMRDFIFNVKSTLWGGNDNTIAPPNFYRDPDKPAKYRVSMEMVRETVDIDSIDELLEGEDWEANPNERQLGALNQLWERHPECQYGKHYDWNNSDETKFFSMDCVKGVDVKNGLFPVVNKYYDCKKEKFVEKERKNIPFKVVEL